MRKIYLLSLLIIFLVISCEEKIKTVKECGIGYIYKDSWDACIDIDECKTNNADCEQNCTNTEGSFECYCNENFILNEDGKTCDDFNNCKEDSCRNNGECIDELNGFKCECFKGYDGANCENCSEGFELYSNLCLPKADVLEWSSEGNFLDVSEDFVADSKGNIFIVGYTNGEFNNSIKLGGEDFFLTKVNDKLEIEWTKIFGTSENDENISITIDSDDNLYIAGSTNGSFFGISNGNSDIALLKIDKNGDVLWKNQNGTSDIEVVFDIAIDSNRNIYTAGYREDEHSKKMLSLKKFNIFGDEIWTKEEDADTTKFSYHIAINGDNLYLTTTTKSNLIDTENIGNDDLVIIKYNLDGERLWAKQWGSEKYDKISNILIHDNNIYITGYVNGNLQQFIGGSGDIFLTKLNEDGDILFDKKWTTNNYKVGSNIAISPDNKNIYVSGYNWETDTNYMVLKKLNMNGELIWSKSWFSEEKLLISILFNHEKLFGLGLKIPPTINYNPLLMKFNF